MKLNFLLLSVFLWIQSLWGKELYTAYTEDLPPISFQSENRVSGIATEIVEEIFNRAEIDISFTVKPWKRAYKEVLKDNKGIIYALGRSKDREKSFQWIGPILIREVSLWSLKERQEIIPVATLADLKKYVIGVTRGELYHHFLLNNGFKDYVHLSPVTQSNQNAGMLIKHRIDAMIGNNYTIKEKFKIIEKHNTELVKIYTFNTAGYYIGANLAIPEAVIERLTRSFEAIKATEFVELLHLKYKLEFNKKNYSDAGFGRN